MNRGTFLIILGALVVLSPFAGLPMTWLAWILPILGLLIILAGNLVRQGTPSLRTPRVPNTGQIESE